MTISTWTSQAGGGELPYLIYRRGMKQIPFIPSVKPILPYEVRSIFLGDAELGPFGRPASRVYWGELRPQHLVSIAFTGTSPAWTSAGADAYARAYAKFKDLAYTQASNLTAIAEIAKTRSTVNQRLLQLWKGAKALRAGKFKEFLNTFGLRPMKKHQNLQWTRPKQFGTLWLEYWMGWAPAIGDISNSIETLSKDVPGKTIRTGSSVPFADSLTESEGTYKVFSKYEGEGTVWIQAMVEVTNPNTHLQQSLGLINVAQTVWEIIPFSWLVDWFTNVGQVLGQFTDWVGLQLKNLTVSVKTRAESSWHCSGAKGLFGASFPDVMYCSKEWFWFTRFCPETMPPVKPKIRFPPGLSLTRGATLASLLVTIFAPHKR